jgi:hypothetical protein
MSRCVVFDSAICRRRALSGPAWRAVIVRQQPLSRSSKDGDTWLDALGRNLPLLDDEDQATARRRFPVVAAAADMRAAGDQIPSFKQMALAEIPAADNPAQEVGERLSLSTCVVEAWERLVFDVRDLRGAAGWVTAHLIEPERRAGDAALTSLMMLAIGAGAPAVRAWLDRAVGLPLDDAERLFHQPLRPDVKMDVIVAAPLDSARDRRKFLRLSMRARIETKRRDIAHDGLAPRCEERRKRQQLARQQVELTLNVKEVSQ